MQRKITLPNGDYLLITFEKEGVVYDLCNKNHDVIKEYGFDLYTEDLGLKVELMPFPFKVC
jgi:hypothetical protein